MDLCTWNNEVENMRWKYLQSIYNTLFQYFMPRYSNYTVIVLTYLNIKGKSFSSSSLLPSVAKQYGLFCKNSSNASLLSGPRASLKIAVLLVLKMKELLINLLYSS